MRHFFSGFPTGDPPSESEMITFHLKRFQQYQLKYAESALLDGVSLTEIERELILMIPKEEAEGRIIEISGAPSERQYIDNKISQFEELLKVSPGNNKNYIILQTKTIKYLEFLKDRKEELSVSDGSLKFNEIPTRGTPEKIMEFWLKLKGQNEKGESYWDSKEEIKHFVHQNFKGFPGVKKFKTFSPNMNKKELQQATWHFFDAHGVYKSKNQYAKLLKENFKIFENTRVLIGNIKDGNNKHLRDLLH